MRSALFRLACALAGFCLLAGCSTSRGSTHVSSSARMLVPEAQTAIASAQPSRDKPSGSPGASGERAHLGSVAEWPEMKPKSFEGDIRAFNGSKALTPFAVQLTDGFELTASGELDATYALKASDGADGVLVSINMDGHPPDLDAEASSVAQYRRHVTKKEKRAHGFLVDSESEQGDVQVVVAIETHHETMTCTADLYTDRLHDKLVPWAERMCSSLEAR